MIHAKFPMESAFNSFFLRLRPIPQSTSSGGCTMANHWWWHRRASPFQRRSVMVVGTLKYATIPSSFAEPSKATMASTNVMQAILWARAPARLSFWTSNVSVWPAWFIVSRWGIVLVSPIKGRALPGTRALLPSTIARVQLKQIDFALLCLRGSTEEITWKNGHNEI